MKTITITTDHVMDALSAGPTGVIVHQTEKLDDWASGAARIHYAKEIESGWLTVAADYVTLSQIAEDVAPGVTLWDAEWQDALPTIAGIVSARINGWPNS